MMKRFSAITIAMLLLFFLTSCGSRKKNTSGKQVNTAELIQNMIDAGCSETTISCFISSLEQENEKESLCLLERQREELLCEIHKAQLCIDFLNELLCSIKEEQK